MVLNFLKKSEDSEFSSLSFVLKTDGYRQLSVGVLSPNTYSKTLFYSLV